MITEVGVVSFFESYFAGTAEARSSAGEHLSRGLVGDFPEAAFAE